MSSAKAAVTGSSRKRDWTERRLGGVVGDDDGPAGKGLRQAFFQPFAALAVQDGRVEWGEASEFRVDSDQCVIVHGSFRRVHAVRPPVEAENREVGPERAAKEAHAAENPLLVFEIVDVGAVGGGTKFVIYLWQGAAIILVVARHVDNGDIGEQIADERNGPALDMDIAGEHDHVDLNRDGDIRAEFKMKVGEDVDFHG